MNFVACLSVRRPAAVVSPPSQHSSTDHELVTAAQGGDRGALDQLLRRHYDRVHAVCRRITGHDADAADAAQEAMIAIVRNLDRFDGRSSFGTWAYRIATNASLDELRRRKRRAVPVLDRRRPRASSQRGCRSRQRSTDRGDRRSPGPRRRAARAQRRLPAAGRAPRRRRSRLRGDRRGARHSRRHGEEPDRPRPSRAGRSAGTRRPTDRPGTNPPTQNVQVEHHERRRPAIRAPSWPAPTSTASSMRPNAPRWRRSRGHGHASTRSLGYVPRSARSSRSIRQRQETTAIAAALAEFDAMHSPGSPATAAARNGAPVTSRCSRAAIARTA